MINHSSPFLCAEPGCAYLGLWSRATRHRCPMHSPQPGEKSVPSARQEESLDACQ